MTWTTREYYYHVEIDGVRLDYAGDVSQSESLDSVNTVFELELSSQPTARPAYGDDVVVRQVDRSTDTENAKYQFKGTVSEFDGESFPYELIIRCVGILDDLNVARIATNLNLTGMTDGEAVEAVLTACGVPFDPADISDFGYVLGEQVPVYWKIGQTGADIIGAIDDVFGMKTLEVGNGRVVRFRYDLAPDTADAYRTFTKGTDADVRKVHRTFGNRSLQQSSWTVQGASYTCDDNCNCQPWAEAVGTNPRKRSRVNASDAPPYQSDIIQDEPLAQWVAERLMRWYNRTPDVVQITTANDVSVHPGTVVNVSDDTYSVNISTITAYTVQTVARSGDEMTLTATGGAAGSTGTVTTGVNKRCNDTDFDIDLPNLDFDPISIGFPPIEIGFDFDFSFDFGWGDALPTDGGGGGSFDLIAGSWVDEGSGGYHWTISGNNLYGQVNSNAVAHTTETIPERSPGVPESFRITFDAKINGTDFSHRAGPEFYLEDSVTERWALICRFDAFYSDATIIWSGCGWYEDCVGDYYSWGDFMAPGVPTPVVIEWDTDASEWRVTIGGDGPHILATDNVNLDGNPLRLSAISSSFGGVSDYSLTDITVEPL